MRKPAPLRPGSRVRLVALAAPPDPMRLARGVARLEELGLTVDLADCVARVRARGDLAGTDKERARDLVAAFEDPDVDGVVCSNGGYGSLRILPLVDWAALADHPKIFVGYSDITAIHVALTQQSGLVTFHGPMGTPEAGEDLDEPWSFDLFRRALFGPSPLGEIGAAPDGPMIQGVTRGRASGPLAGGNLSLVAATLGTPFEIDTRGKVLLLEDWNEPPFTIETLLLQLKLAGKLDDAAAVVLGEFRGCLPGTPGVSRNVPEVVRDVLSDLDVPAVYGFPAGHAKAIATLPLGVRATVDVDARSLSVDEAATAPRGAFAAEEASDEAR